MINNNLKVYLMSLGCPKNLVDSEILLGNILGYGFLSTEDYTEADLIVLNTCAFTQSAIEESEDIIKHFLKDKKQWQKFIVTGCLPSRDKEMLNKYKIDGYLQIKDYPDLSLFFEELFKQKFISFDYKKRILNPNPTSSYIKIAEGCNNCCSYCTIPLIRGSYHSRSIEDIKEEVKKFIDEGSYEINLISQDTTNYGLDINTNLINLLREITMLDGDFKIRLLYLYPSSVSVDLIDFIAKTPKIYPYFDLPIQHSETHLLKSMNRRYQKEDLYRLFSTIKTKIPTAILRTTIIVGFPDETDEDINNLIDFIRQIKFDRLGVFTYSAEKGTSSALFKGQIKPKQKLERQEKIYLIQEEISKELNQKYMNEIIDVIVEGYDEESYMHYGRSMGYAPDGIDGYIYFGAIEDVFDKKVVKVKILDFDEYNLYGQQEED